MWFSPLTLTLITTHRCTAACEHCCFACSPTRSEAIPLPRLRSLLEETREVPSLAQVVFTGGECFLLGEELDALVARCSHLGLAIRCVTNGYWAVNPDAARARVRRLREAGLTELNFSTGEQHARFVPWERVAWGAAAAAEAGLQEVVIDVEDFLGSTFEAGRGGCESLLRTLSVTPDLDLIPCCGLNLEHIPQLHVANLADRSLREALEDVPPGLLKMWIHVEGPERVLEFVREVEERILDRYLLTMAAQAVSMGL